MDDLERRIRAANPFPPEVREAPLSARALAELDALVGAVDGDAVETGDELADRRRRRRPWRALATVAASVAVLVTVVLVATSMRPNPAPVFAATPDLLVTTPVPDRSAPQVLGDLAEQARAADLTPDPYGSDYQQWAAQFNVESSDESFWFVQSNEVAFRWQPDLSGSMKVTAGEPYAAHGVTDSTPREAEPLEPGTVLSDDQFDAGEAPVLFTAAPPRSTAKMREYLTSRSGTATEPAESGAGLIQTVHTLLSDRRLSSDQEAAVLEVLGESDDIRLAGTTQDRLGRPGYAFEVREDGDITFDYVLIVSEQGRILAQETIYQGGWGGLDLPVPSVINYTIWR